MRVVVNNQNTKIVSVSTQGTNEVIAVGIQGPAGPQGPVGDSTVTNAIDVDASALNNGSVLVYKTQTNKWTATTILDAQNMEGGEF